MCQSLTGFSRAVSRAALPGAARTPPPRCPTALPSLALPRDGMRWSSVSRSPPCSRPLASHSGRCRWCLDKHPMPRPYRLPAQPPIISATVAEAESRIAKKAMTYFVILFLAGLGEGRSGRAGRTTTRQAGRPNADVTPPLVLRTKLGISLPAPQKPRALENAFRPGAEWLGLNPVHFMWREIDHEDSKKASQKRIPM